MGIPKLVPLDKIEKMRYEERKRLDRWEEIHYDPRDHANDRVMRRHRQQTFLEIFSRCMSPKLACKQSGVSASTYSKWRRTDSWFAEHLNSVIEEWEQQVVTSAVARAIGYTRIDPKTGEVEVDADGKVIYHGASDNMAKAILERNRLTVDDNVGRQVEHEGQAPLVSINILSPDSVAKLQRLHEELEERGVTVDSRSGQVVRQEGSESSPGVEQGDFYDDGDDNYYSGD